MSALPVWRSDFGPDSPAEYRKAGGDHLEDRGLPAEVWYILVSPLIFNAPHLVETYGPMYDMRWENEWRIKGRLSFTAADVAFLIVPDAVYKLFMEWLWSEDLHDYLVMPSSVFTDHLAFLRILPTPGHSSWGQIRLFDQTLPMDFDEFVDYTDDDREKLQVEAGEYLACLAKAEVQEVYERRYVDRYLAFVGQLDEAAKNSTLLKRLAKVEANRNEPWHSSADLVRAAYEALFKIQADRITKDWLLGPAEQALVRSHQAG